MPGTEVATGPDGTAYSVEGTVFARALDGGVVQLELAEDGATALLADVATARRTSGSRGVRLPLADVNGMQLNHWLRRAWSAQAPRGLAEASAAADAAKAGEVSDSPRSIGAPATRALVLAGLTSLGAVAERRRDEVAALHGVGPRAVQQLEDALAERGLTYGG